jgi:regulator of protease activity HflC (stomatin/prohibitin superfamily)
MTEEVYIEDFLKRNLKKIIFGVLFVFIIIPTIFSGFYTVDEGHVGIVKRFSKAQSQVDPGLHFKIPFIDGVQELEIRTRKNVETLKASTFEQMPVDAQVSINWTVTKSEALDLYKKYGGLDQFENRILDPRLRSAAKDAIAKYKTEKIIQNRGLVISEIESTVQDTMKTFPVKLDSVQLEDFEPPPAYTQSIEVKQREKNFADAEAHKLRRQNLQAQQSVNTAKADRDSAKARADGKAYATLKNAEAEAKAIKLKGEAEAKAIEAQAKALRTSKTLVEYVRAQRWNGQLPTTMLGGESSNILWNLKK